LRHSEHSGTPKRPPATKPRGWLANRRAEIKLYVTTR
jgi:hypothetical protein